MFDPNRPCSSFSKKKNRYTKKELMDLRYEYKIVLPENEMTITEMCEFYKTLDWQKLKKKKKLEIEKKKKKLEVNKKIMIEKKKKMEIEKKMMIEKKKKMIEKKKKMMEEEKKKKKQKQIQKKKEEEKVKSGCLSRSKQPLRDYQRRVVKFLGKHNRLLVYHKMGTGKTLTAVTVSQCYLDANPNRKVIVITPASLTDNFKKGMMQYGNIKNANRYEFYSIQKATRLLKEDKLNCRHNLVIIDEVHNYKAEIKYRKGKLVSGVNIFEGYKCFLKASKLLLLTGTPVYNRPEDLDVYKVLLNYEENKMKGKSVKEIVEHYKKFGLDSLQCKISYHDFSKNDMDFPRRIDVVKKIRMRPEYEKQYKKIIDEIEESKVGQGQKKLLGKVFKNLTESNKNQFENLTRRLTQNIDNNLQLNAKLDTVIKYLQKMETSNKVLPNNEKYKAVIYSQFKEHGIYLLMQQTKIPYGVITGDTKVSDRQKLVNAYNSGKLNVLFITKAGGEGLDLKGTDAIILMEPTWNENNSEQIIARAIRYKSHEKRPENRRQVRVIHLIHTYSGDMTPQLDAVVKQYIHDSKDRVPHMPNILLSCDYKMLVYQQAKQNVLNNWDKNLKKLSIEQNNC